MPKSADLHTNRQKKVKLVGGHFQIMPKGEIVA